jgi:hypothetical protein
MPVTSAGEVAWSMSRVEELVVLQQELQKTLEVLDNSHTCLETAFLRVSRFFENSLDEKRWHTDLLDKMALRIEGIREQVVSAQAFPLLLELLRFRHFKRYYFELEYDWDKLDFLLAKYQECTGLVRGDLVRFIEFLKALEK